MNERTDITRRLDKMFFPETVAVVGASDVPGKWGNLILTSIIAGGYQGRIYPVNPKKDKLLQLTSYPSLLDIPGTVDLAIFVIPAEKVPDGIRECAAKGIPAAVIISSGFRETGGQGAELEKQIVDIANSAGITLMGPNTMGLASAHHRFEAIPTPTSAGPGGLAIISQSGNLGLQILKWTAHKGIGLSIYAGTGNEAQLNAGDLLSYLGTRDEVKAVAMYIEGITDGTAFARIARGVSAKKPVIAIKTGRSKSGSMAAQSHTGSLA
ncbi:MAG: CoA-binding protein, partial [Desulfomonilia bacterium]|nr:CoA-binding protein [Desulfomonilia bacterium]